MNTCYSFQKSITYFQPKLWYLGLLGLSLIALLIGACDKPVDPTPTLPTKVELSLKQGKKAELTLGDAAVDLTTIFEVKVTPNDAKNKKVSWSLKSDADREKATLLASGTLTAKQAGAITIVATADADKTIKGEASFTIKEALIKSIAIASTDNSLVVGEKLSLTVRTTPTAQAVTWSVSDETIASIDAKGQLTAKKAGTVIIKAMSGGVTSNEITITVQSPPVTAITIQSPQTSIEVGETLTLTATTTPAGRAVTWEVDNTSLASIDAKGKLTAKRKGTVKVTAKADGITSNEVSIKLTATSVTAVTIQSSKTNLEVGEMLTLTATTTPTGRAVIWSVDKETVASIDEQGMLTAKKTGSIKVQAKVGDVESNELTISVSASSVTAVAIQSAKETLTIGEKLNLTATTTPANRAVAWSVDDASIASIDEQGMLTAKQSGTVKVTATAVGSNVSDKKTITVQASPVTQVIVTAAKTNIYVNEIISLTATTTPSGRAVTWSVDDVSIANIRENGQLTAKKVGTVNVTAKAGNKSSTPLKITIEQAPVTRVMIESPQDALGIGESITVKVTTTPTGRAVTWSVSDESIASIDANGQLTAKKEGTLTVTATAEGVTSNTLTITANSNPLVIKGKSTVYLGDSTNFTAELSGATTNATWSIKETGEQYGTIDAQGLYKAPRFLKVSKSDDINVTIVATTADKTTTKQLTISLDSFPNTLEIAQFNRATYSNTTNGNRTIYLGVTSIGNNAFFSNRLAKSMDIPNSVTTIGNGAFRGNQLTSVTIPNAVTSIGQSAFENNDLKSVTIPDSVTSIGDRAFFNNQLTSVTIGSAVTSIGEYAFTGNQLTSVTIPNAVTSIGKQAFQSNKLTSVTIPNSVTSIGQFAFLKNKLTSVTIPNSVTTIGQQAFYDNKLTSVKLPDSLTSIGNNAFASNPNLTEVTLSRTLWEKIKNRKDDIFESQVQTYKDPSGRILNTVTAINIQSAKTNVLEEDTLTFTATTTPAGRAVTWSVSDETIASIDANGQLTAKKEGTLTVTATAEGVTSNTLTITVTNNPLIIKGKDKVYLGDTTSFTAELSGATTNATWSIKETGEQYGTINAQGVYKAPPFLKVSKSDDIKLTIVATTASESTTKQLTISLDAFPNALEITPSNKATYSSTINNSATIYLGVTFIQNQAFESNQLTSVSIPNGVTTIGIGAFESNQLTSVSIPNGVTTIGIGAFSINQLTSVNLPDGITAIGEYAFQNNELTSVTIGNAVTSIGEGAFQDNKLTSVTIGNAVTSIGDGAFKNNELASVIMQESLFTTYKDKLNERFTFQGQYTIKTPAGKLLKSGDAAITVTSANKSTYTEVSATRALTFKTDKGTIKIIGVSAFYTNNLTSVKLPESVTSIGEQAFTNNNLTSVSIGAGVTSIGDFAFTGNPDLTEVTLSKTLWEKIKDDKNFIFGSQVQTYKDPQGNKLN